jgi:flagellar biosynthesis protein FliR
MNIFVFGLEFDIRVTMTLTQLMPSVLSQFCSHDEKDILFGITNIISSMGLVNQKRIPATIAS